MADDVYSHGHHESVLRSHTWRTVANSCAYLVPRLSPDAVVLDVGCGPGTITIDLARHVPDGRVLGLDRAGEVIDAARAAGVDRGVANVEFATGDVYALDLPDDSFDVVHAHQVLQHLTDPVAALRELRRVCRPGGVVAVRDSDYEAFTWYPSVPALDDWLDLYRRLARSNGAEPDAGRRLLSWALAAGFDQVEPSASVWCYADDATRAWWSDLWADRAVKSAFAEQVLERGMADEAELERLADGWRTWGAAPDGWLSILHGEILATA